MNRNANAKASETTRLILRAGEKARRQVRPAAEPALTTGVQCWNTCRTIESSRLGPSTQGAK
jgi:hypothetical protein